MLDRRCWQGALRALVICAGSLHRPRVRASILSNLACCGSCNDAISQGKQGAVQNEKRCSVNLSTTLHEVQLLLMAAPSFAALMFVGDHRLGIWGAWVHTAVAMYSE